MSDLSAIPPRRRGGRQWFVAILPGQWSAERVRALAEAVGLVALEADQMLRRPLPHVAPFGSEPEARGFAEMAGRAGVEHVCFSQEDLDRLPEAVVARRLVVPDDRRSEGPYRGAPVILEVDGEPITITQLRLAVVARLGREQVKTETTVISDPIPAGLSPPAPRRRQQVLRDHADQWVFDLYGATAAPLRILEQSTELVGMGVRKFERRAAMLAFRRWLEAAGRSLVIQEGYSGFGIRPLPTRGELRRDDAVGWDAWSAASWVIASARTASV